MNKKDTNNINFIFFITEILQNYYEKKKTSQRKAKLCIIVYMTGRTHDLAAFTAVSFVIFFEPVHTLSLGTLMIALAANLIGGLAPDIDQPTAKLWHEVPAGTIWGKIIAPLFGGHRFISHSLVGLALFGFAFHYALFVARHTIVVDETIVWWSFMIGFFSHLIMDTITREGVPWLFPIPIKFGFPPIKHLRIKTGGFFEKLIIFPGLLLANVAIYYTHYHFIIQYLKRYIHQ